MMLQSWKFVENIQELPSNSKINILILKEFSEKTTLDAFYGIFEQFKEKEHFERSMFAHCSISRFGIRKTW